MINAPSSERRVESGVTALVADDHVLMREGIKAIVRSVLGQVSFLEAQHGDALLRVAAGMPPFVGLAFVDLRMSGMYGGLRLGEMAHRFPQIRVIVVSVLGSPDFVRRAMNIATVHACVPKDAEPASMRAAIEAALQGRKLQPLLHDLGGGLDTAELTPRQIEVHRLLRRGMSNKMIADALRISEGTVKNHVTDILRALNATNRTQAARFELDRD